MNRIRIIENANYNLIIEGDIMRHIVMYKKRLDDFGNEYLERIYNLDHSCMDSAALTLIIECLIRGAK